MNSDSRRLLAFLAFSLVPSVLPAAALAQDPAPSPAQRVGQETRDRVAAGRTQLDNNDARAIVTLRDASQNALIALNQVSGQNVLTSAPESLQDDPITTTLAQRAAEAHYYWGVAADRFARRDEAITALTRSLRISRAIAVPLVNNGTVRRDAGLELGRVLREGLPLIAPDDALDSIASISHGNLWKPRRFTFDTAPLSGDIDAKSSPKYDYLVTDGKLFPPVSSTNQLYRIPPFYQPLTGLPEDRLPAALHFDKMVAGYVKEASGSNKGQWRQSVRVFYASPYSTKNRRDDLPRARALCEQFLKVQSLFKDQLGATNVYARGDKIEGVTTLWLLEISALWPQDDENPDILAQLGPMMPKLNVGPKRDAVDPDITATERPWMAVAGQAETAPGEIMFWKASMARPEAEWARELFHEYGHVSLPPFGGFRPPLEPFGNGMMGETLGMLWAAQTPDRFGAVGNEYATQVNTQALPALRFFLKAGPASPLRSSGTIEGWRYLQGLTTYVERVYGGKMLGRALTPLSNRAANIDNIAMRRSLMGTQNFLNSMDLAWRDVWGSAKTLPIWLPGAFGTGGNAANLIARSDATLKAKTVTAVTLYVPAGTASLRIDGAGAGSIRAVGLPFRAGEGAMRIYFAGKTGWQTFSLTTGADAKISGARFERR